MSRIVIAAVRNMEDFEMALASNAGKIFFLQPSISNLQYCALKAHKHEKELYIHIDMTRGRGKDRLGIEYAKSLDIDGIISTKASLIKAAKECGLKTVQRFFIVDSQSMDTAVENLKSSKADMAEIMPGVCTKAISKLKGRIDTPIIAGGLISETDEIADCMKAGACAVSTGEQKLWNIEG